MPPLQNHARYRKVQLNADNYLGAMDKVIIPFLKGALLAGLLLLAYGVGTSTVEAGQRAAENKAAIALHKQADYIKGLENIVGRCTSPGENVITIDGVYYFCGAASTGIKVRP